MRRRLLLAALCAALALALGAGAAWAADVRCQPGSTDAEPCRGTEGPDRIVGTPEQDIIEALAGRDVVLAAAGNDSVFGGRGEDLIGGRPGDDEIWGGDVREGPGGSYQFPDASDDVTRGGPGNDFVLGGYGQGGVDRAFGGRGDDIIQTDQRSDRDNGAFAITKEVIRCGPGFDTVFFDKGLDVLARPAVCEDKRPISPNERAAEGARGLPVPPPK